MKFIKAIAEFFNPKPVLSEHHKMLKIQQLAKYRNRGYMGGF
jgi:hypothetical protein